MRCHRILNETLPHALASMMPCNIMMARAGHGANQPRGHLPRQNFVPGPKALMLLFRKQLARQSNCGWS